MIGIDFGLGTRQSFYLPWRARKRVRSPTGEYPRLRRSDDRDFATQRVHGSEHARVRQGTVAKEESGSVVCGTQKSDRVATLALMAHEVHSPPLSTAFA